jgi:hypothetical protein
MAICHQNSALASVDFLNLKNGNQMGMMHPKKATILKLWFIKTQVFTDAN